MASGDWTPYEEPQQVTPLYSQPPAVGQTAIQRVTRRLIPYLFVLYVVCFLDRINVSFAALQMNADLKLTATQYGLGAGIFFVGYVLFQVPGNLIMSRIGARLWIGVIMIVWGLIAAGMTFIQGPRSLYACRVLLGFAEAGFFPGVILYLTHWFPAPDRARAVSLFMIAIPIAAIVGGPISGMILSLGGLWGVAGWRWLFVLEALPAVVLGVVNLRFLTNRPEEADWLEPAERDWLSRTLEEERERVRRQRNLTVTQALGHRAVWTLGLLYGLLIVAIYGLSLWLPLLLKEVSKGSNLLVGFLSAIPQLAAAVGLVVIGTRSDRTGERLMHIAVPALIGAAGLAMSAVFHSLPLVLVALSLAAMGTTSTCAPFWSLPNRFLAGNAAAAGIALINSIGNLSGFLGPYLLGYLRDRTHHYAAGFWLLAALLVGAAWLTLSLRRSMLLGSVSHAGKRSVAYR